MEGNEKCLPGADGVAGGGGPDCPCRVDKGFRQKAKTKVNRSFPAKIRKKRGRRPKKAPAPEGGGGGSQILDRAASSATRVKSLWSWRMEAGTRGVTGPKKASRTMPALLSPETTITTRSACMMSQMPMV